MYLRLFLLPLQLLVATVVLTLAIYAADRGEKSLPSRSAFRVLRSSAQELVVVFHMPAYTLDTLVTDDGVRVVRFVASGIARVEETTHGAPERSVVSAMIAVPSPSVSCSVEVHGLKLRWIDLPTAPYSEISPDRSQQLQAYQINHERYRIHRSRNVECVFAGISRGIPLARLSVPVSDYDPATNRTRIIEQCTIRVVFPESIATIASDDGNVPVLNVAQLRTWQRTTKAPIQQRRQEAFLFAADAPMIKVSVEEEGVYSINAEDLAKLGVNIPASLVPTIKLYGYGGQPLSEKPSDGRQNTPIEQPLIVETNNDGSLRAIVFYAAPPRGFAYNPAMKQWRRYLNPYTTKSSYLLTWGGSPGLRATPTPPITDPPSLLPQYFIQRVLIENDRINAYGSPSGLRWFGDPFDGSTGLTLTTQLHALALNASGMEYTICVAHKMDQSAIVSVSEHGFELKQIPLPAKTKLYSEYVSIVDTVRVPIERVANDRRAVLRLRYQSPDPIATGYIDYVEIAYPSLLVANNNELHVYTEPTDTGVVEFSVSGFTGKPLCFDVTNPTQPQLCANVSITEQQATIRIRLDSASQRGMPRQFFFSATRRKPDLEKADVGRARDNTIEAEMVIVAPTAFLESATAYAEYRQQHDGLQTVVIPVEHIYAAFAAGMPDPTAIRDFISFAYFSWRKRPQYVLLWGDGHYDYRNLTTTTPNWIPPYQNDNVEIELSRPYDWSYADDSYATEDYFGCVDGDDYIMDVAIGRLTISSEQMGMSVLSKIQRYEQSSARDSWAITATLVADDGPTSNGRSDGALHVNSSERIARKIETVLPGLIQRKVYMPEYPVQYGAGGNRKPSATEAMLSIINGQGTLLLQWIGHGNPRVWAHEEVFDRDKTITLMRNQSKMFFLVAATCDFARFDMTDSQSGAEKLVEWEYGGAIGVFSATRVVYTIANEWISLRFYEELAKRTPSGQRRTLGDVLMGIKLTEYGSNDRRYFLLGDPAMRLKLPELNIRIDSIKSQTIEDTTVAVCALEHVSVSGSLFDAVTNEPVEEFEGVAIASLFDADVVMQIQDPSELALGYTTTYQFWKTGGMLHRGAYPVEHGQFRAEFTIPKDATLSENACRLHVYAIDRNGILAGAGSSRALKVNCVQVTSVEDREGPEITIYLDSRSFRPGDIVRANPELIVDLRDETGINSTGIGIGHKIEAWVDDNLNAVDLTEYFEPSLEDSRRGTAKRQLFGLSPGYHTITVRAWDVLNNFSTAQVGFVVTANDSIVETGRVDIYPQPFSDHVNIAYNHNQSSPLMVTLMITQLDGRQIYEQSSIRADIQSTSFQWDGRTTDGRSLPAGVYPFVITIENGFGSRTAVRGLLVKIQ